MSKRRITGVQSRRIEANQAKRKARAISNDEPIDDDHLGPEQSGLIVAHYGGTVLVETPQAEHITCSIRQNLPALVVGDHVVWQPNLKAEGGVIGALLDRKNLLYRGTIEKLVAANVDQLVVVIAPEPAPGVLTLDRYLVAGAHFDCDVLIVLNKTDLIDPASPLLAELALYAGLGYRVLKTQTKNLSGLDGLKQALSGKTNILVGQSGVGKSSIVNHLIADAHERTSGLTSSSKGRHTTSTTRLWHLNRGGDLIDSPGVRQFWLTTLSDEALQAGFIEFRPYLGKCRFRNCRHEKEPNCAILGAVQAGAISPLRLKHFYQIRSENDAFGNPDAK